KPLTFPQIILLLSDRIPAFPFGYDVEQIIGSDSRSETVQWLAFRVSAKTQIEIRKFSVLKPKNMCFFHPAPLSPCILKSELCLFVVGLCITYPSAKKPPLFCDTVLHNVSKCGFFPIFLIKPPLLFSVN